MKAVTGQQLRRIALWHPKADAGQAASWLPLLSLVAALWDTAAGSVDSADSGRVTKFTVGGSLDNQRLMGALLSNDGFNERLWLSSHRGGMHRFGVYDGALPYVTVGDDICLRSSHHGFQSQEALAP